MTMKPICIYHANCADGFTAAWVVYRALGDQVEFVAGVYGNPPPDVKGRDVLMVDFSYKRSVIEAMALEARSILILDHHKSAAEDLAGFLRPIGTGWQQHLDHVAADGHVVVYALFDMARSGAGIAWDYFHPGEERPHLVDYVEDRDLWRFNLPHSREINANIFSYPYDFGAWDEIAKQLEGDFYTFVEAGAAIERKHHKDIGELVKALRRRMVIGGHDVPVANLPYTLTSDAGHLMAQGEPFAACYWDTPEGRVFSLRAADGGLDVSAIAKAYGGGGHAAAAGFRLPHGQEP